MPKKKKKFFAPNGMFCQSRSHIIWPHYSSNDGDDDDKNNWRASVASETLTGVKMKKSGMFVYWRASVASETVLGVDNAKSGICYMYICMYVWIVRMPFKRARRKLFSSKNTAF